jgi:Tfp pilus assembly protein PilO
MAISDYRFENLPRSIQIVIFSALVFCLAFAFYFYYLKDIIKERDTIQKDIARLELEVAQGTAIESRLKRFRQELKELEERLVILQQILPAEKETPTVLRGVQQMAASSNLKINKFTPKPVVPRAFYSDWPIQLDVEGTYDGLGTFFEKISQATRIVNVDSITINGVEKENTPTHTLTANCTATTFVFRENQGSSAQEQDAKNKGKGKNRKTSKRTKGVKQ